VGSVYLSHRLLPHSIYTLKLHNRGIGFPYFDDPDASGARPAAPRPAAPAG